MSADEVKANGWTAVSVSGKQIFEALGPLDAPSPLSIKDAGFPSDDPLVAEAQQFVRKRLSPEAFNHSMRVFYWGRAIATQILPTHAADLSLTTWALTCLLHDIGTAEAYFSTTRMSFDIYGGIKALEVLKILGATTDQAEAVAEAIIRHEDMGVDGQITFLGQLIQLATLYDNVGVYEGVEGFGEVVHERTKDEVNTAFPRLRWCEWFAGTVRREEGMKPWCHTTHIPGFDKQMEANTLQKKWE
ncbi:cyanamide hydratase [Aaosphaeria arxii CBS 175.79]|uniref:Cyanamide hydratase n=1 Tax=Aaosphaeria arxii CBS 175.79 TaxID=1450172 RepID=A0A6A5XEI6_9PLEO|nr:cyanamide hydratase [Aaosphaeria arxii CBS 175.79]KAF2011246.1 cyanamide hydratase [Aaosphaeria arxii CBS 175.79]